MEQFDTQAFNLHPTKQYPLQFLLSSFIRKKIFIENAGAQGDLTTEDILGFGGVCFDLSHLEDTRRMLPELYHKHVDLMQAFTCGANHISAVRHEMMIDSKGQRHFSHHVANDASEFEYLASLDPRCISQLCAIELENPLVDQLNFIAGIKNAIERGEDTARTKRAA